MYFIISSFFVDSVMRFVFVVGSGWIVNRCRVWTASYPGIRLEFTNSAGWLAGCRLVFDKSKKEAIKFLKTKFKLFDMTKHCFTNHK